MKKVFLVRKDVTKPYGKDNWQIMTLDEFKKFRVTDAAKGRQFARIFDYDSEGDVIIKECEPAEMPERNTALSRSRRKLDYMKKHNIKEVPFITTCVDDELVSSEQLFVDETQDVEEIVGRKMMLDKLKEALTHLTADEQRIIQAFFFNEDGKSARQIAKDLGLPWSTAKSQKAEVLKKLRKFF